MLKTNPLGQVLAEASLGETVLFAEVTPERVAAVREQFQFLPDRR